MPLLRREESDGLSLVRVRSNQSRLTFTISRLLSPDRPTMEMPTPYPRTALSLVPSFCTSAYSKNNCFLWDLILVASAIAHGGFVFVDPVLLLHPHQRWRRPHRPSPHLRKPSMLFPYHHESPPDPPPVFIPTHPLVLQVTPRPVSSTPSLGSFTPMVMVLIS